MKINTEKLEAALYITPTPIGNLEDISHRVVKVLASADIIACEDTRRAGLLLSKLGLANKILESYHEHNEARKAETLSEEILAGKSVALTSDAGSPAISDPGYRISKACRDKGIKVISLPGPSALIAAISASGLPPGQFKFLGFPPQKKGRKSFLEKIKDENTTVALYESPYRIEKLIGELIEILGPGAQASLSREISKVYEEHIRGDLAFILESLRQKEAIKGEFTLVIDCNIKKRRQ